MASQDISTVGRPGMTSTSHRPFGDETKDDILQVGHELDEDTQNPTLESDTPGVKKVERFSHVLYHSGKSGRLLLFVLAASIGLTMFGYALDQGITSQFTVIAASAFSHHAEIGAVNTAASIIRAISKPFIGKLSDITSRPTCYVIVLAFYVWEILGKLSLVSIRSSREGIRRTALTSTQSGCGTP